jgi:hypothetical protein
MQKLFITLACCLTTLALLAQSNINRVEYFLDSDPGFGNGTSISITPGSDLVNIPASVPIGNLSAGVHKFFLRSRNADGKWSITNSFVFAIIKPTAAAVSVTKAEYFLDADPGFGNGTIITITPGLDKPDVPVAVPIGDVAPGVHKLSVRSASDDGRWSVTNTFVFAKLLPPPPAANIVSAEYFYDTDPGYGKAVPLAINASTNLPDFNSPINITGLAAGSHKMYIRSRNADGKWSITNVIGFNIASLAATPFININSITNKFLCGDQGFLLAYHATGTYNNGNVFTVQMSDINGSFASPVAIGSLVSTASSTIKCTIPTHVQDGSGYKIRVVSSDPQVTGITSDTVFSLLDQPRFPDTTTFVVCLTDKITLQPLYNTSPYTTSWSTQTPSAVGIGSYLMYTQNTAKCKDTTVIIVKQDVNQWTGAVSKNWHDATNWSTGRVPNEKTHVFIIQAPNICELSQSDVNIASIQLKPGGVLNIINNRQINIIANCKPLPVIE